MNGRIRRAGSNQRPSLSPAKQILRTCLGFIRRIRERKNYRPFNFARHLTHNRLSKSIRQRRKTNQHSRPHIFDHVEEPNFIATATRPRSNTAQRLSVDALLRRQFRAPVMQKPASIHHPHAPPGFFVREPFRNERPLTSLSSTTMLGSSPSTVRW